MTGMKRIKNWLGAHEPRPWMYIPGVVMSIAALIVSIIASGR